MELGMFHPLSQGLAHAIQHTSVLMHLFSIPYPGVFDKGGVESCVTLKPFNISISNCMGYLLWGRLNVWCISSIDMVFYKIKLILGEHILEAILKLMYCSALCVVLLHGRMLKMRL